MSNINRQILIAGPAASGKTFLLNNIRNERCPRLCEQLGIDHPASWRYSNTFKLISGEDSLGGGNLLIHCDLHNEDIFNYVRSILCEAPSATVVTLCASSPVLAERNKKRIFQRTADIFRNPFRAWPTIKLVRTLWFRQKVNRHPLRLISLYNSWFDLLQELPVELYWLDSTAIGEDPIAHLQKDDRSAALQVVQSSIKNSPSKFSNVWNFSFRPLEIKGTGQHSGPAQCETETARPTTCRN